MALAEDGHNAARQLAFRVLLANLPHGKLVGNQSTYDQHTRTYVQDTFSTASLIAKLALVDKEASQMARGVMKTAMEKVEKLRVTGWATMDIDLRGPRARSFAAAAMRGLFPSLKSLELGSQSIGDDGVRALVEAAQAGAFPQLEELGLGGNEVGDDGASVCAQLRRHVATLKYLNLDSNDFQDEGAYALADMRWLGLDDDDDDDDDDFEETDLDDFQISVAYNNLSTDAIRALLERTFVPENNFAFCEVCDGHFVKGRDTVAWFRKSVQHPSERRQIYSACTQCIDELDGSQEIFYYA